MSMMSAVADLAKKMETEKEAKAEKLKSNPKPQEMVSMLVCSLCERHKKTTLRRIAGTKGYICSDCLVLYPETYQQLQILKVKYEKKQRQQELMKKSEKSLIVKPTTNELINVSTGGRI